MTSTDLPELSLEEALAALDDLVDDPTDEVVRGDTRDGRVYVVTSELVQAAKVALITGRPLLLSGPPGGGKSSFASYLARNLGVSYYEFVCSEESRPAELLWTVDSVRRLADAQAGGRLADEDDLVGYARYVVPGPFWWATDPDSATTRGMDPGTFAGSGLAPAPSPRIELVGGVRHRGSVLLVDEVDKADNAFTSGLLVPIGSRMFDVPALGTRVTSSSPWSPLVVVSTNNERDLSPAFLRRCVAWDIPAPSREQLVAVAMRHLPHLRESDSVVRGVNDLADLVVVEEDTRSISTAEFLDLVRVLVATGDLDVGSEEWATVRDLVLARRVVSRGRFGLQ